MAFLNLNKLNAVARTAAKAAADAANDAIGTGKIAVKIKREEMTIEQQYEKIGEYFYKQRCQGLEIPAELEECCVAIDLALASIKELEVIRNEMRESAEGNAADDNPYDPAGCEVRLCPNCGREVSYGTLFCSECGSKLPDE